MTDPKIATKLSVKYFEDLLEEAFKTLTQSVDLKVDDPPGVAIELYIEEVKALLWFELQETDNV